MTAAAAEAAPGQQSTASQRMLAWLADARGCADVLGSQDTDALAPGAHWSACSDMGTLQAAVGDMLGSVSICYDQLWLPAVYDVRPRCAAFPLRVPSCTNAPASPHQLFHVARSGCKLYDSMQAITCESHCDSSQAELKER